MDMRGFHGTPEVKLREYSWVFHGKIKSIFDGYPEEI
jgi:hypothetical protein